MILPISHYLQLSRRGLLVRVSLITLIAVLVSCASVSLAQEKSAPEKLSSPDVLVLVLNGMGPYDQVSINYSGEVSKADSQKDLATLAANTKWSLLNTNISTQGGSAPGLKPTTSATFQVLPIVNISQGVIPLEPFILALKRFHTVQVNYLVASQFVFKGLKNFENEYVNIRFQQSGNSYLYTVNIKNSDFDRLNLPLKEGEKTHQKAPTPLGARILMIVALSALVAVLVYLIVSYLTKARERS